MKKKNRKILIISGLILLLFIIVVGILIYVNNNKNNFSFSEKSWINQNANNVIDISMEGNLPIFSNNGEGVFYDYIKNLESSTGLTFNVTVNSEGNYNFKNKNELSPSDLVFYTDHYVLISTNSNVVKNFSEIKNQNIGVVKNDLNYVSNYLSDYGLNYKEYDTFDNIKNDMDNSIIYAIIPMEKYMNEIVNNKYHIVKHIEGLHSHYVLSMKDANTMLANVFTKYFNTWEDSLNTSRNKNLLKLYYDAYSISDLEKESIIGDDLLVGYISNLPFEGKINNKFSGITNEYLRLFADMTGASYKYIEYSNIDKLNNALSAKKVDFVLNYYNVSNNNYTNSVSLGNINYVVVTHKDNYIPVDSIKSVIDDNVKMVNNTSLYSYIKNMNVNIDTFDNYKSLLKNINKNDVLILEKNVFDYYKNDELKNYLVKYIGETDVQSDFLLNSDNTILNNLFNFYISTLGNNYVNNMAISHSIDEANTNVVIKFILSNITYLIVIIVAIVFFMLKFNKKIRVTKKIRKEDKMMYLDVMTNLKNRNYLNDNLNYWESNKVYPQAVVVVDLNSISVINDTKGHEEGDRQIKSAANILIRTQRENSEIIRTDGNEFLIYLVGYEDKQVVTYVNKLIKEFKNLPYEYGASVGYYMINSESTTIDDAINEALIMMRKNKGN